MVETINIPLSRPLLRGEIVNIIVLNGYLIFAQAPQHLLFCQTANLINQIGHSLHAFDFAQWRYLVGNA